MKTTRVAALVAVLLAAPLAVNVHANPAVNWNAVVADNIEYYTQTDKAVYVLGDNVDILHRVTNLRDEEITFEFANLQDYMYFEVSQVGSLIWAYPSGPVNPAVWDLTLQAGDNAEGSLVWEMVDGQGSPVAPGVYDVSAVLQGTGKDGTDPLSVSVSIQIVPEPASVTLVLLGGVGLVAVSRHRRR